MGEKVSIARVRKHGLRVLCARCGTEFRHKFEIRLRHWVSPCCGVRLIPAWHVTKLPNGLPKHPKHYARAHALRAVAMKEYQERLPGI